MSIGTMFSKGMNSISASRIMRITSKVFQTFALAMATVSLMSSLTVTAAASATIGYADQPQFQPHAAALISSPSTFASMSALSKPDYGITNVTAQIGTNAYLPCLLVGIFVD